MMLLFISKRVLIFLFVYIYFFSSLTICFLWNLSTRKTTTKIIIIISTNVLVGHKILCKSRIHEWKKSNLKYRKNGSKKKKKKKPSNSTVRVCKHDKTVIFAIRIRWRFDTQSPFKVNFLLRAITLCFIYAVVTDFVHSEISANRYV